MDRKELEERTIQFSINLIGMLKKLPKNSYNTKIISQCVRAGTSVGANYGEANGAESRKDFIHKLNLSFKEARETRYWLSILKATNPMDNELIEPIWIESDEIVRIFGKSVSTSRHNSIKKMNND
jgi:four helix bundle protein